MQNRCRVKLAIGAQVLTGDESLIGQFVAAADEAQSCIWLDVEVCDATAVAALLAPFDCHPLALQDALDNRQPPKVEAFSQHLLFVYRGIQKSDPSLSFTHQEMSFLVGKNYFISLHSGADHYIDEVFQQAKMDWAQRSPLHLALKIMRLATEDYLHSIVEFEQTLSDIEDGLNQKDKQTPMVKLNACRSRLLKLRRIFNYHENISHKLLNETAFAPWLEATGVKHEASDLHDHFERLNSLTQMYYNICSDLLDAFLSFSSYRLNITMSLLTVITAIFVPLSFLAGVYGMNFEYMPELKTRYGYFILLGVMFAIAAIMLWWFRRKDWL